jgi:hypothetical protein
MNAQTAPPVIPRAIQFSLSRWDVVFCRLWVLAHNGKLMAICLLMAVGYPILSYRRPDGVRYPESIRFPTAHFFVYFAFTFAALACLIIVTQILFHTLWVFVNKNRGVVGEHTIEIQDDGLLEKTAVNQSLHRWAGFHKIQASRSYLFVFVTDNIVHYIPLRSFASAEAAKDFREELQRRAKV